MSPFVLLSLCPYSMFIVALNKSATLSTTQAATIYNPSNAVDGKKYCNISILGTMSSPSLRPWLLIQLKMTFDVTMVTAFASDYCM